MSPKVTTNPTKLATILAYFHNSGVAHSVKDLEKALPSIASINSMAVKDYLTALTDEDKVRVEKIGSGNWYWAFAGEERRAREGELERVREGWEGIRGEAVELRGRVEEGEKERAAEDEVERAGLLGKREGLMGEVETLRAELEAYRDSDPAEMERKRKEVEALKLLAEKWTDHVLSLEGYLKGAMGMDKASLMALRRQMYGDEFDEEEGGLREL